ncbi:hypothetical protein BH09MYX1_BH09MYX1_43620 [soil metagenome]
MSGLHYFRKCRTQTPASKTTQWTPSIRSMAVFVEILIPRGARWRGDVGDREEVDDAVHDALEDAGLGEVSGGGTAKDVSNIDVEIDDDERFAEAIAVIREVLVRAGSQTGRSSNGMSRSSRYLPSEEEPDSLRAACGASRTASSAPTLRQPGTSRVRAERVRERLVDDRNVDERVQTLPSRLPHRTRPLGPPRRWAIPCRPNARLASRVSA